MRPSVIAEPLVSQIAISDHGTYSAVIRDRTGALPCDEVDHVAWGEEMRRAALLLSAIQQRQMIIVHPSGYTQS